MIKYRFIISLVSVLLFIWVCVIGWRTAVFFSELATVGLDIETGLDSKIGARKVRHEQRQSLDGFHQITVNSNVGHYETIEKTVSRLKRDVYVTGALTGVPGQEQAFFKIEGMPDRSFNINTQLMDGFIITEITNNHVVLKNQVGDETFSLFVGGHERDAEAEPLLSHSEDSYQIELLPENKTGTGIRIMNDEHLVDEATASGQQLLSH